MTKVLHVISGDLWAGAEVVTSALLRGLKEKQEISISVVVLNNGRLANELLKNGIDVKIIDEAFDCFCFAVKIFVML